MSNAGLFRLLGIAASVMLVTGCGANLAHPTAPVQTSVGAPIHHLRSLAGRMQPIYDFNGSPDGSSPVDRSNNHTPLIAHTATDSMTTYAGGDSNNDGTVASVTQKGHESVVYTFKNTPDGANPAGSLYAPKHTPAIFYLATTHGGTNGLGAVIQLTATKKGPWREQPIYSFSSYPNDGNQPWGTLIGDSQGNLYGTTFAGGTYNRGTVYRMAQWASGWTESVLYSFTGSNGDGANPYAGLSIDGKGNLYGTTYQGGDSNNDGVVYKLTLSSSAYGESVIHTFNGGDGSEPHAGVCIDPSGNLWGTTNFAGAKGAGTVFELSSAGSTYSERVVWNFGASGDGANPTGGILMDSKGRLYGTTEAGGASASGAFFTLTPAGGKYKENLYSFSGGMDGSHPYAGPSVDNKGNIIVTASQGGTGYGAVSQPAPTVHLTKVQYCVTVPAT